MNLTNSSTRWGAVSMLLHWTVVVLIIAQFVMANIAGDLPLGMQKLAWEAGAIFGLDSVSPEMTLRFLLEFEF